MSTKLCKQSQDEMKLPSLSKDILEIKKRIQLSEGQRKALFEEIQNESKRDGDEILRLRKEIAKATLTLHEQRTNRLAGLIPAIPAIKPATISSAPCKRVTSQTSTSGAKTSSSSARPRNLKDDDLDIMNALRSMAGCNVAEKSLEDLVKLVDLHRIDNNKQLDLLHYKYKQKEATLKKLAEEYQQLLVKQEVGDALAEKRAKQAIEAKEFRNRINAIQVQIKEAEHVRTRYKDIRWKLQEDAAKFESKMAALEDELKLQEIETEKIRGVHKEAVKLRTEARHALQKEEKQVMAANAMREKQSSEGKRLVDARAGDLEKLERHFYQQQEQKGLSHNNGDTDGEDVDDEDKPSDPMQEVKQSIEVLKEATGSTSIEEVLEKVKGQTTTQLRLMTLKKSKENAKQAQQRKLDAMTLELERLKFADDKDNQQNLDEVQTTKDKIQETNVFIEDCYKQVENTEDMLMKIVDKLLNTYFWLFHDQNQDANEEQEQDVIEDPLELIAKIKGKIRELQLGYEAEGATVEELLDEINEREADNWLPAPYNDIIRRTPVPSSGSPPPAPPTLNAGSEDEEELPTRGYLKRQAQLVIDAKNKRKTMRFPIPKGK